MYDELFQDNPLLSRETEVDGSSALGAFRLGRQDKDETKPFFGRDQE